ncbi:MAG: 30S ribosomal protein S17e [Candidatus Aenigmarchaeota archaeon]|jgi:small subunit ribosomal protein S17e|nr:30S ribosomal protein S17e [Candidatus Aenigmarchaeota archaeon]
MGRIKSVPVKNLGDDLMATHGKKFTTDFDKNKKVLGEVKKIKSKRTRNVVAGYITKQMQKIKEGT